MTHRSIFSLTALLLASLVAGTTLVAVSAKAAPRPQPTDDNPVGVTAVPQHPAIEQGGKLVIAVVMEHKTGYHTWPAKEVTLPKDVDDFAIRTEIGLPVDEKAQDAAQKAARDAKKTDAEVDAIHVYITPAWVARLDGVQYPESHKGKVADPGGGSKPLQVPLYSGKAIAFARIDVKPDASVGDQTFNVRISYQSCNEQVCTPPQDLVVPVKVKIVKKGEKDAGLTTDTDAGVFAKFESTKWGGTSGISPATAPKIETPAPKPDEAKPAKKTSDASPAAAPNPVAAQAAAGATWDFDFIGWKFSIGRSAYWLIMPIAFVAGFLLNLTPCVLPVIPIKVLSLQQQAEKPAKLALFGTVYCIGIVATFLVLGLLIFGLLSGGQKQDWGQIFTNPWFTGFMAVVVAALGFGMMGFFTIRLPQSLYMINPSHDTVLGNFLLGVLTAVLSTPCTGPLLGATVAWSATQAPWVGLVTFVVMGIGMASPYAVLIALPKLIERFPRAGPGGELLKQVLGLLMLAVGAFLAGNLTPALWPWYVVGALACVAFVWAIIGGWRMLRHRSSKFIVTALSMLAIAATVYGVNALVEVGPIPWNVLMQQPDDAIRTAIADARKQGKVVVIDFTAKWCINCHFIEKTVLNSDKGRLLLTGKGVAPIKVDLGNSREGNGWGVVKDIAGGGGIPLIAVFGPAGDKPIYFQSLFPIGDLEAAVGRQRAGR